MADQQTTAADFYAEIRKSSDPSADIAALGSTLLYLHETAGTPVTLGQGAAFAIIAAADAQGKTVTSALLGEEGMAPAPLAKLGWLEPLGDDPAEPLRITRRGRSVAAGMLTTLGRSS